MAEILDEGRYYRVEREDGMVSLVCRRCHARSYHPKDVEHRYCGVCHQFLLDLEEREKV